MPQAIAAEAADSAVLAAEPRLGVREVPMQTRLAALQPATFNAEARTVEVVWTTGARVRRYDWFNDQAYEEELVVSAEAIDMSRFDAGAVPVLDSHGRHSLDDVLGTVRRAWIERGVGKASLQMSERDDVAGLVRDIASGVIRNVSVGYSVQRYEIVRAADRTDGGKLPLYRAVRWQPQELSFVPIPADASAGTRSQSAQQASHSCEFVRAQAPTIQEPTMTEEVRNAPGGATATPQQSAQPSPAEAQRAIEAAAAEAVRVERQRVADIGALCTRHAVPADKTAKYVADGLSVDQVTRAILDDQVQRDQSAGGARLNVHVQTTRDEDQTRMAGMEEAIAHRVDPRAKLTDNGRQFRGMSLIEIGRDWLELRGVNTRGMDRMKLAQQILHFRSGMHTTSDFGALFENVGNKRLRAGYEENRPSYQVWARRAPNAPDFKSMSVVQLGAAPDLLQVNEHGEFKYGAMTDGKETYSMITYGRIVSLTRQAIINDDLRAFDRLIGAFGNSAARLENRTVYAVLTANAALGDGVALFHTNHANLGTGAGSALSITSLGAGRTAMRLQKGLQLEELNLAPSYMIVPAALEQTAYQLTSTNYVPATKAEINEFRAGGRTAVEPVVESLLDANSATAWYLAASNMAVDTIEYCFLDGAEGPVIESEVGFEVDGISYKCREDFAAKAIDHRGLYKANGA